MAKKITIDGFAKDLEIRLRIKMKRSQVKVVVLHHCMQDELCVCIFVPKFTSVFLHCLLEALPVFFRYFLYSILPMQPVGGGCSLEYEGGAFSCEMKKKNLYINSVKKVNGSSTKEGKGEISLALIETILLSAEKFIGVEISGGERRGYWTKSLGISEKFLRGEFVYCLSPKSVRTEVSQILETKIFEINKKPWYHII